MPEDSKCTAVAFDFTQTSLALEGFACDVATIHRLPGPSAEQRAFPLVFLKSGANWWDGAKGMLRLRDAVRVALKLYSALQDERSAVSESLKQVTRQYWGRYVDRQVITETLSNAGLKI